MSEQGDITRILQRVSEGDAAAQSELMTFVYAELRQIAARHLAREYMANTLQATALVHEAYLRLYQGAQIQYANRSHFFAVASRVMRRILVENARQRGRAKHGAGAVHLPLDEKICLDESSDALILALHDSLDRLEKLDERQARIVEMRYFAGLEVAEIATVLKTSRRTVHREWTLARAWLYGELEMN
ncbi:extracytoplasmic sigma factor ECF [Bryobacterales bacterium F-183]|nr:extracytoplasmic sigma factor ECF [Bryobacterales bacterium F-183]